MSVAAAQLHGITKRYNRGGWALRDVDLEIRTGEILGVLGANGSGKSTLLSIVGGQTPPTSGTLHLFGRPVADLPSRELRRRIGRVSQDPALDPEMTAKETLRFFASLYGGTSRQAVSSVIEDLQLGEFLDIPLARVSGGQRQRVNLALGLLQQPDLLLLDEPTSSLDPVAGQKLWQVLETYRTPERAVVVATHHLEEAGTHCDRLAVLSAGALLEVGTPGALLEKSGCDSVAGAFFALTGERILPPAPGGQRRRRMGGAC